ncbi:hypothetical protein SADUNF_Sadunf12G0029900 [Salix dunnii]|uniref:Uncharacterized protein n=1 Tax=Salix dunnii TaxID=1413687 RepID=A0A835MMQ4_9ROSI|nr:hypothetical protein SADUNF_Sadunf12G0029900 [Salix dunnii]
MRTQDPKQDNPQDQNQNFTTENQQPPSMENPTKEALETELALFSNEKSKLETEFGKISDGKMAKMGGFVDGLVSETKEKENEIVVLKSEDMELTMRIEAERNGGERQMGHGNEEIHYGNTTGFCWMYHLPN